VFLLSTRVDADLRRLAINPTVMGENRMFKTAAAAEPITDVMDPADTVPLSVLALDLDAPSAGGWHAYLASRGIAVLGDDVGRDSIGSRVVTGFASWTPTPASRPNPFW
jgi:hypothetical protein